MATKYQIKSQESTVKHLQDQFNKLTKEVDITFLQSGNFEDPKVVEKMNMLNTIRNVLVEQEKKLVDMRNEETTT